MINILVTLFISMYNYMIHKIFRVISTLTLGLSALGGLYHIYGSAPDKLLIYPVQYTDVVLTWLTVGLSGVGVVVLVKVVVTLWWVLTDKVIPWWWTSLNLLTALAGVTTAAPVVWATLLGTLGQHTILLRWFTIVVAWAPAVAAKKVTLLATASSTMTAAVAQWPHLGNVDRQVSEYLTQISTELTDEVVARGNTVTLAAQVNSQVWTTVATWAGQTLPPATSGWPGWATLAVAAVVVTGLLWWAWRSNVPPPPVGVNFTLEQVISARTSGAKAINYLTEQVDNLRTALVDKINNEQLTKLNELIDKLTARASHLENKLEDVMSKVEAGFLAAEKQNITHAAGTAVLIDSKVAVALEQATSELHSFTNRVNSQLSDLTEKLATSDDNLIIFKRSLDINPASDLLLEFNNKLIDNEHRVPGQEVNMRDIVLSLVNQDRNCTRLHRGAAFNTAITHTNVSGFTKYTDDVKAWALTKINAINQNQKSDHAQLLAIHIINQKNASKVQEIWDRVFGT